MSFNIIETPDDGVLTITEDQRDWILSFFKEESRHERQVILEVAFHVASTDYDQDGISQLEYHECAALGRKAKFMIDRVREADKAKLKS